MIMGENLKDEQRNMKTYSEITFPSLGRLTSCKMAERFSLNYYKYISLMEQRMNAILNFFRFTQPLIN